MQADRKHKRRTESQTLQWTLSFAQGYLELGMFSAAERELSKLSLKQRCLADALELRVRVMLHQGRYKRAAALSSSAAKMYPGVAEFYSYAATAYEQLDQPENAKKIWISAPSLFHVSGIFHFALARFEAQLGNDIEARQHIALAIELDPTIQSRAARDPELSGFLVDFGTPSAPEPATGLAEGW
jgi:tetratricopeptide (TPR) repeat protein